MFMGTSVLSENLQVDHLNPTAAQFRCVAVNNGQFALAKGTPTIDCPGVQQPSEAVAHFQPVLQRPRQTLHRDLLHRPISVNTCCDQGIGVELGLNRPP